MLKSVDVAVYDTIKLTQEGKFAPGVIRYGLSNKGVDYTGDKYNEKLITPDMKKKLEEIRKKIIAGTIAVPDFYKKK
jgi:basic membrane protein A